MQHPTLDYLYNLPHGSSSYEFSRMRKLMEVLNHPYRKFPSVHIAGTNGKGSTCAFLSSILQAAGYTVGLYTSPHLVRFHERIQINRIEISDDEIIELTEFIKKRIEEEKIETTFFEFTTALAFLYFAKKNVDIAIIEVGLGGRLDATNVILPLLSLITNISFDHTQILGETLKEIAQEKAGIIKTDVPLLTSEQDPQVLELFRQIANDRSAKFYDLDQHLTIKSISSTLANQTIKVEGVINDTYTLSLLGEHQLRNAGLALLATSLLSKKGFIISKEALKEGLYKAFWMGRLEVVSQKPLVIIDGAHNVSGMQALCTFLQTIPQRKVLILAIAKDKNISEMVHLIAPLFETIIVTQGLFKPAEAEIIAQEARKHCKNVIVDIFVHSAVRKGFAMLSSKDCMVMTGSLYMIGSAREEIKKLL